MVRGVLFIGCFSTDNYQTATITWPDTKTKYVLIRQPNGIIIGEKI